MPKVKLLVAAYFAVLAFSAVAAATALAAGEWDVNGVPLGSGKSAEIAKTAHVGRFGKLSSASVEFTCEGGELLIRNGFIVAPDGVVAEDITFHGCRVIGAGAENCSLSSTLILTLAIHGLAELDEGLRLNTVVLLLPLPSKTFAVFNFTGEKCAIAGTQPVTSSKNPAVVLLIDEGYLPKKVHLILAFSLKESLKLGSIEATLLEADEDFQLASGAEWNFL